MLSRNHFFTTIKRQGFLQKKRSREISISNAFRCYENIQMNGLRRNSECHEKLTLVFK